MDCLLTVLCVLLLGFGVYVLEGIVRGLIWLTDDDWCMVVLWTGRSIYCVLVEVVFYLIGGGRC